MLEVTGGSSSTLVAANKQVDWPTLYSSSSLAARNAEHAEQLLLKAAGVEARGHTSAAAGGGAKSPLTGYLAVAKRLQHHGMLGNDTQQPQHRDVHLLPLPAGTVAEPPDATAAAAVAVPVAAAPSGAAAPAAAAGGGGGSGGLHGEEKHRGLGGRNIYPTSFWVQVSGAKGPRIADEVPDMHPSCSFGCYGCCQASLFWRWRWIHPCAFTAH